MKETDLYYPVKKLFMDMGYTIKGEVNDIDLTAVKDDTLIAIELKTSLNLKLYTQAAIRQRIADAVYVAIPRPSYKKRFYKTFKDKEYLLRRLEIGLIFVALDTTKPYAQIVFDSKPYNKNISKRVNNKKRNMIMKEITLRHGDYNTGGSNKTKLVTAYREKAIFIAACLLKHHHLTVKQLREAGGGEKTLRILNNNHYGWFERVCRGTYKLSEKGKSEVMQYRDLINTLKSNLTQDT